MDKYDVVILSRHYLRKFGGGERCDQYLNNFLTENNFKCLIVAEACDKEIENQNNIKTVKASKVRLHSISYRLTYYFEYLFFSIKVRFLLLRIKDQLSPCTVYIGSGPPTVYLPFIFKKVFISFHGKYHKSWIPFVKYLSGVLDFGAHNKCEPRNEHYYDLMPPIKNIIKNRSYFRKKTTEITALCICRLTSIKRLDKIISFCNRHGIVLDLYGTGDPRILYNLSSSQRINIMGALTDENPINKYYDFLISFSDYESYNMVIREAGIAGIPSLVLKSADPFNFVTNYLNGFCASDESKISFLTIKKITEISTKIATEVSKYKVNADNSSNITELNKFMDNLESIKSNYKEH